MKGIRKNPGKRLALGRRTSLAIAPEGNGGMRPLSIPLADEDRVLGAVTIVEDTTRAVALAEEGLRDEDVPMPREEPRS